MTAKLRFASLIFSSSKSHPIKIVPHQNRNAISHPCLLRNPGHLILPKCLAGLASALCFS
jgi:hypothetical protein